MSIYINTLINAVATCCAQHSHMTSWTIYIRLTLTHRTHTVETHPTHQVGFLWACRELVRACICRSCTPTTFVLSNVVIQEAFVPGSASSGADPFLVTSTESDVPCHHTSKAKSDKWGDAASMSTMSCFMALHNQLVNQVVASSAPSRWCSQFSMDFFFVHINCLLLLDCFVSIKASWEESLPGTSVGGRLTWSLEGGLQRLPTISYFTNG